jgi:Protein of unknown function (DUF1810)
MSAARHASAAPSFSWPRHKYHSKIRRKRQRRNRLAARCSSSVSRANRSTLKSFRDRVTQNYISVNCHVARWLSGSPDDLKFRSCLTLFAEAVSDDSDRMLFKQALDQFYGGQADPRTMELLCLAR